MNINAEKFDQIAREVFAPAYPVIAGQILNKSQISKGLCIDLGCGGGYLGLAVAQESDLNVYLMDINQEMLKFAQQNVVERKFESRVKLLSGDVHDIPLETGSIHLAVSRGSMFFWENKPKAFQEIYRILAPGGMAFIGGGFGTLEIRQQIEREIRHRNPDWTEHLRKKIGPDAPEKWHEILSKTGITKFNIERGEAGMWITFEKEGDKPWKKL